MSPSTSKKYKGLAPLDQRQLRSQKGKDACSAIFDPVSSPPHAKLQGKRMEQAADMALQNPGSSPPQSSKLEVDTVAITKPILEAIAASKAELMGHIDYLASECNLT